MLQLWTALAAAESVRVGDLELACITESRRKMPRAQGKVFGISNQERVQERTGRRRRSHYNV